MCPIVAVRFGEAETRSGELTAMLVADGRRLSGVGECPKWNQ